MPVLYNISEESLCKKNRELVSELINDEGFIDLRSLDLEQRRQIIEEINKNEESNVIASKENYRKSKYKAKNTSEFLVLALALIVAGLALAPLFIASSIILPVLPVLFFGVAIMAITNLFFNRKIYQLGNNAQDADKVFQQVKVLKQLTKPDEVDEDDDEISNDFDEQNREKKSATMAQSKIDEPTASNTPNIPKFSVHQGLFVKTSSSPQPMDADPVNDRESTLNITHS